MFFSLFNQERNMLNTICGKRPEAIAELKGNAENSSLKGTVRFYSVPEGTIVVHEIRGLPSSKTCFYAMHIHDGNSCEDNFANVGPHYSKGNYEHPLHTGDLTNILSANGLSFGAILTNRFSVKDVLNKVVIIHSEPDDFRSQPSGDSGEKIACGVILSTIK